MAENPSYAPGQRHVVGVFHAVEPFSAALEALLAHGFDRARLSVLAEHAVVSDHFDGCIPAPDVLADSPDTPRESLATEGAVRQAVRFLAETLSAVGTAAAAGAAYAVGGPVGVAAAASDATEVTAEAVLSRFVDASYERRFAQSIADGGIVCWVEVRNAAEIATARRALLAQGGEFVHEADADSAAV